MPTFYGPPSDGTVIPEQLETALAADIRAPGTPIRDALDAVGIGQGADVYEAFDEYQLVSGPGVAGSGDSMTAGAGGDGTSWPSALDAIVQAAYTDPGTVTNLGVGGETSATIAGRTGLGVPWVATVAGGEIPATGAVTVTLASEDGDEVAPLIQGSRGVNPVQVAGVTGTLSLSSGVYTFTRAADGAAVAVSDPEPVSTQAQRERQSDLYVMWWGQNDAGQNVDTIIERQRATIKRLRAFRKRWIVLGLSTGTRASRADMDDAFLAAYGDRFLNIREFMSSADALAREGIQPTQDDYNAIDSGAVPPSFKSDGIHFNAAGYRRAGRAVYEKIKALGWNDQWGVLGDDADAAPIAIEPPPATAIFADDFERTSANIANETTPEGGKTWTLLSGGKATAPIDAGALSISLNGDGEASPIVNAGATDGVLEAVMRTAGGGNPSLLIRLFNFENYLRIQGISGVWGFNHRLNGATNVLGAGIGAVADGDTFRVTLDGTSCTINLNGAEVWSGQVPTIVDGNKYGFQSYTSGTAQRWESIRLDPLA